MPFKTSKLSVSFPDMLKDTSTLSMLDYFIQFLETVGAVHLIQFWLSVESFRATIEQSQTKDRPKSLERRKKKGLSSCSSVSNSGSDTSGRLTHEHVLDTSSNVENSRTGRFLYGKEPSVNGGNISAAIKGSFGGMLRNDKWNGEVKNDGGSAHINDSDGDGSRTNPGSNDSVKTGSVSEGAKKLHRRDTENIMYCNCKVHVVATPPGTPESPRGNGKLLSLQDSSPSVTVKCEHGSAGTSQTSVEGAVLSCQPAPDEISNQS